MKIFLYLFLLLLHLHLNTAQRHYCSNDEFHTFPNWCTFMDIAANDVRTFVELSNGFSNNAGYLIKAINQRTPQSYSSSSSLFADHRRLLRNHVYDHSLCQNSTVSKPIVIAHGMGDSCFNKGIQSIIKSMALWTGQYSICIPMGSNQQEDTSAGYFLNMDASIDQFAAAIFKDSKLNQGFHAIGFSQGNNIIRGYIAKYNHPTVHTFLSINGVNAGVSAVPYCIRQDPSMISVFHSSKENFICRALMEMASQKAYTTFAQKNSFQANYWRDPREEYFHKYLQFSQLAYYNNETPTKNFTLNENYAKTEKFVWILAEQDELVWPKEGEQWGAPDTIDPFKSQVLNRNQTPWYIGDYFGLKSAEENGKNFYESFKGGHLQFTMDELQIWIMKYMCV